MEAIEAPAMIAALVLIFGVVGAKVMITGLVRQMNRQISQVAQIKAEALNRLKAAQSQKAVANKNKLTLQKKKAKIEKKLSRLKSEMSEIKGEEDLRRKRAEQRRVS